MALPMDPFGRPMQGPGPESGAKWSGFVSGLDAIEDPRLEMERKSRLWAAQTHVSAKPVRYSDNVAPSSLAYDASLVFRADRDRHLKLLEPFDPKAERIFMSFG